MRSCASVDSFPSLRIHILWNTVFLLNAFMDEKAIVLLADSLLSFWLECVCNVGESQKFFKHMHLNDTREAQVLLDVHVLALITFFILWISVHWVMTLAHSPYSRMYVSWHK